MNYFDASSMKKHRNQSELLMIKRALHKYEKKNCIGAHSKTQTLIDGKKGRACRSFRYGTCQRNGMRKK